MTRLYIGTNENDEVRRRLGFAQSRAVLAAAARFQIPICRLNSRTFALRQSDLEKLIARSAGEVVQNAQLKRRLFPPVGLFGGNWRNHFGQPAQSTFVRHCGGVDAALEPRRHGTDDRARTVRRGHCGRACAPGRIPDTLHGRLWRATE
jgi:hypothetical protein